MSESDKISITEKLATLSAEDQRNLAFFVAGMAAKVTEANQQKSEAVDEK